MSNTPQSLHEIVDEAVAGIDFGTVTLTIKRSNSLSTTVDLTKITRRKVQDNAQALTLVGTMLKLLKEAEDTGNLTFTVTVNKGNATELMVHDFDRKNLREEGKYSG
jgi:hypothetical protein